MKNSPEYYIIEYIDQCNFDKVLDAYMEPYILNIYNESTLSDQIRILIANGYVIVRIWLHNPAMKVDLFHQKGVF